MGYSGQSPIYVLAKLSIQGVLAFVRLRLARTTAGFGGRPTGAAWSRRPKTRASCHSPRLGRGEMVQSHPLSFNPRQSPGLSVGLRPMTNACRPQSSHRMQESRKAARALKAAAVATTVRVQAHRSPRRWRKWDSIASTNTRTG